MFEKEAEEYSKETFCGEVFHTARNAFKDGAEFGYNKGKAETALLSQHIIDLQKDKGNLTDRVRELEQQIEKMKVKWHDLEKDPNDLPKNCKTMCICLGDFGSKYQPVPQVCIGYCDSLGWSDYMGSSLYSTVRYWCELPK